MKKILVIEDSEALLNDIVEMLSLEGFEVMSAQNGKLGIAALEETYPDLILCDVRMPVMDGYGVLDYLRSDPTKTNIPFIFLTARTGRDEVREGMQLGADDYLTKPFTAEELISTVHARIARSVNLKQHTERKLNQLRESIVLALPHELRTPLNAIMGFSEILATDSETLDSKQVVDMAEHINQAAVRLYRLIENYVIYTSLEVMRTDEEQAAAFREGRTSYPAVIIAQHAEEKARQYEREDDLQLEMPENNVTLAIEGENLSRIARELIDNALKFSEAGTPIQVQFETTDDMLRVRITDQGVGMETEHIRAVGAYVQFNRSLLEQQGIGLGLTIAKYIVEIHNGTLKIDSNVGNYTTVTFTLPLATEMAS